MKKHLFLSVMVSLFFAMTLSAQIHHWPLKSNLNDIVGDKDGTNNGVTFEDDATRGPVAYFNGDGYANLPSFIAGNDMTEITVSCWFRMDETRVWSRIYSFGEGDQTEPKDVMMVIPVGGNSDMYRFTLSNPDGAWYDIDMPAEYVDIQLDTWYFSAVVLKPDSIILYHNDQKVFAESGFSRNFGTLNDVENAIGKSFWADALWKGAMSDLRVYNTALQAGDLSQLYTETLNGYVGVEGNSSIDNTPKVYSRDGKINIVSENMNEAKVSVYSMTGALVGQKPVDQINLLSFDTGVYIIKVEGPAINYATKVFVNN